MQEDQKLVRSWNTTVKMIWDLPWETHKRFVESLTEVPHLQSTLHGRSVGFLSNVRSSEKVQLNVIFEICKHNVSTQTGRNIAFLLDHYGINDVSTLLNSKKSISDNRVNTLEDNEEWIPPMLEELSLARLGFIDIDIDSDIIDTLIEAIASA